MKNLEKNRLLNFIKKKDELKKQLKELEAEKIELEKIVRRVFADREKLNEEVQNKISVCSPSGIIIDITKVEKISINFIIDKVEALCKGDELRKKVIQKKIVIHDIDAFSALMKEYGVPRQEMNGIMHVEKTVNKDELERLLSIGVIYEKELSGAFTTTKGSGYFKYAIRKV